MNISNFDLNLLRTLDALLATHSTTRAAARIGLSQPAVSAALNRLRHAFGDPLLVRQGRTMVPTDFAEGLREPVRQILRQTQQILTVSQPFDPALSEDRFRLSGSDFYAQMLLPQLADRLARAAPGIRVQLVDQIGDNQVEALADTSIDMAILPHGECPGWIDRITLHRSGFALIARDGHPEVSKAGVKPGAVFPLDLFCDLHHVLFSPDGNLEGMGDAALTRLGRSRTVVMSMPVFSGVYHAVSQSDLIALIPKQLADQIAPRLELEIYQPPMTIPPVQMDLVWHRRATAASSHRWLRDQIAQILAALDDGDGINRPRC